MVKIEKYTENYKKDWDFFCDHSKNSVFLFKRDFMEYHKERYEDISLVIKYENKIIALLPCSANSDQVISHNGLTYGGFILGQGMRTSLFLDVFKAVIQYYSNEGYTSLVVKSLPHIFTKKPSFEQEYAFYLHDAKLIKRDLSTVIKGDNRGKVSKGKKWIINKAKKSSVDIIESQNVDEFIKMQNMVLSKHDTKAVHTSSEIFKLMKNFPENIKLFFAHDNNEYLAASLLFIFENTVHTQYLATTEKGKEVGALDYLIENRIQYFLQNNFSYFSFGVSTTNYGRQLNFGLCQQKESFGGSALAIDTYEIFFK